ncbi:MAG: polyprenyl synthetase family protein [Gemmatimonadaceae bacterium]
MDTRLDTDGALADIQAPVRDEIERVPEAMWRIVTSDNDLVGTVTEHLMGMRGKLFRPTLLLLCSATERPVADRAVHLAAVTELIHLGTLIHDDSVDHSALRRGRPTVNALFSHQLSVLMGDFLYVRAMAELVRDGDLSVLTTVTAASSEMTLGEIRQLAAMDALAFSEADYDQLIRSKTASLFSAACEVGSIVGGGEHRAALARYGDRLGHAFQIADDLLDYTADPRTTGKPHGTDLREHKVTLPLIAALRDLPAAHRGRVERLFADSEPDDALIADVIQIVTDAGGLEYARRSGDRYAEEAEEALAGIPEGPVRGALADAIAYVLNRRS